MAYHRQIKIKTDGKFWLPPSETEIKRRRIKHLQKYKKKILAAELTDLPQIINNMYSYVIKRAIFENEEFLKEELIEQIDLIIDSYKNSYSPMDYRKIKTHLLNCKVYSELRSKEQKEPGNEIYNNFLLYLRINFFAIKLFFTKYWDKRNKLLQ